MPFAELRADLANMDVPDNPQQARALAFEFLIRLTDVLGIEGRGPDQWEVDHILQSLGAIQARWYRLAIAYTSKAITPPEDRAEHLRGPSEVTRAELIDAIAIARG